MSFFGPTPLEDIRSDGVIPFLNKTASNLNALGGRLATNEKTASDLSANLKAMAAEQNKTNTATSLNLNGLTSRITTNESNTNELAAKLTELESAEKQGIKELNNQTNTFTTQAFEAIAEVTKHTQALEEKLEGRTEAQKITWVKPRPSANSGSRSQGLLKQEASNQAS